MLMTAAVRRIKSSRLACSLAGLSTNKETNKQIQNILILASRQTNKNSQLNNQKIFVNYRHCTLTVGRKVQCGFRGNFKKERRSESFHLFLVRTLPFLVNCSKQQSCQILKIWDKITFKTFYYLISATTKNIFSHHSLELISSFYKAPDNSLLGSLEKNVF